MDSATRKSYEKKNNLKRMQDKSLIVSIKEKLKIKNIFRLMGVNLIMLSGLILIAFFVWVGFFIVKKNLFNVENVRNEKEVSMDESFVNDEQNIDDVEESNVFRIVIDIQEFQIDTDIIEGEIDDDLHKGVVHQKGSATPSQYGGNVVITGHRWYPGEGEFSKVFQNLDKLKKEDKINIEYKNKMYTYKVNNRTIVETADTGFLQHTSESQLTIYTCHPKFTSDKRLVYTAILDSVEDIN